ncbi:ZIP zinc/iron transport family [Aspergillus karnatakaensis]|uniref:ZIP zinc/iron transport family n=1 Tax=Aspergillus karnatakaensis TaxID=1810916 RepID=UPI003CCCBE73
MDISSSVAESETSCQTGNEYDGNLGLRISAIFVIFLGSLFGILFPIYARRASSQEKTSIRALSFPPWMFFVAKFFGSGVIIATAFIHLLAPASEALRNPCLTGLITEYPWVEAIVLISVIATFFIELLVTLFASPQAPTQDHDIVSKDGYHYPRDSEESNTLLSNSNSSETDTRTDALNQDIENHLEPPHQQHYKSALASLLILESGVIFHSILIGLALSVSGKEFKTLYLVLIFHQTFEGLGLGVRLADIPWPTSKHSTPYLLGLAYASSTPLSIALGLIIRGSYTPGSATMLVVSGIFDSISAGILIYTALVELLAHEFLFSRSGERKDPWTVLSAFFFLCLGAASMAVLGKWA